MSVHVNDLAHRLLAVNWSERFAQRRSQVALMREYLRRSALWSRELNSKGWPFFDIAADIDPKVRAEPSIVSGLKEGLPGGLYPMVVRTCVWSLHFAALRDAGIPIPDLPDPFEPLILMYERGNGFKLEGTGFIEVDFIGVRKGTREDHLVSEQRAPMNRAALDALDRA